MFSAAEIEDPKYSRLRQKLGQPEPATRAVQISNLEAMLQIAGSGLDRRPETVAMADVIVKGDWVVADGAAFQSEGSWYKLAFRCRISARGPKVQAFEFQVGDAIPRKDWKAHSLPTRSPGLVAE